MPYTDETLKMLGEKGVGHIQVMCRALLRIVWRRWKRLPSKTVKSSSALAGKNTNIFRRLMLHRSISK